MKSTRGSLTANLLSSRVLLLSAVLWVIMAPSVAFAHPSPSDIAGIPRHDVGVAITVLALGASALAYLWTGLRRSSRASTVEEFFFFSKQVSQSQYFDVTIGYSFQVVVTLYFVYWGFRYGVGILYYAVTWLIGIWLFQLAAPKLLKFAESYDTLHGFLSKRYGASIAVRRLTASCTLAGLVGALLIEVSYTTDALTALSTRSPVPEGIWIAVFALLLSFTWLYVQHGGYKGTVLTDTIQLVITYSSLAIVFAYLAWLGFRAGVYGHSVAVGLLLTALWLVVAMARRAASPGKALDRPGRVALVGGLISGLTTVACAVGYWSGPRAAESVRDLPDSFSLAAFAAQDKLVLAGFTILNLAWQFFDMTAWQRISSLDFAGSSDESGRLERLRRAIGETKWESPVTWAFGITFGIALRHTNIYTSASQALDSFWVFLRLLVDNDLAPGPGMLGSYVVLPALLVAVTGIMLTTVSSFLATVTFTWIHDIALQDQPTVLSESVDTSGVLRQSRVASFWVLVISALMFILVSRVLHFNIFLALNTIYSAQFAITFLTLGALFLRAPAEYRNVAVGTTIAALISNLGAAAYCYNEMSHLPGSSWEDWFYILPTIASCVVGVVGFGVPVVVRGRKGSHA